MAEQFRRRFAKPQRLVRFQHGIPFLRAPHFRIRGEIIIILRFERRACRWESCRMHQFTGMWLNPNSRGSRLRIWQPWGCNSLHAHHFRRLASAGIADPGDLKSPSLPGASPGSPTGVWLIGNSRPIRLKIEQPWECFAIREANVPNGQLICKTWEVHSPHADQLGMSTGRDNARRTEAPGHRTEVSSITL